MFLKKNTSYREALITRWYDFFWLIPTQWTWFLLLRIIPYSVRSYQLGVVEKILFRREDS